MTSALLFLILVAWTAFCIADAAVYAGTKYPERASSNWYKVPGGGFIARLKFGNKE